MQHFYYLCTMKPKGGTLMKTEEIRSKQERFRKKGYLDRRDDGRWYVLAMNSKIK